MRTTYRAMRCPCGQRGCRAWMVAPGADVQGVSLTEMQARAVAALLNSAPELEQPVTGSYPHLELSRELEITYAEALALPESGT